ncbi:hypothetical protein PNA2_1951 [Pyrococcus sp. NA2]|uniref:COG1470 family protein n=1 Tax=Pyrococcus sp. (strain NA2) TaxID=342949 RepID=UPI000209AE25|nr:NEW3 domain-containing protein [Pyrococcus sp. NA2]AEC52865.1 hypothetical protein PNA2_1951 [Pyrococcus sp. NA2]
MKRLIALFLLFTLLTPHYVFAYSSSEKVREIDIFEGRILPGEKLTIGDYVITVEFGIDNYPYVIVSKDSRKLAITRGEFGAKIEVENLTLTLGSYNTKEGLLILASWRSQGMKYRGSVGNRFEGFEVVEVTNSTIILRKGVVKLEVPANKLVIYGNYGIEFSNGTVYLYKLPKVEVTKKEKSELVVSYQYIEVLASLEKQVQIPILLFNNGTEPINVTLSIVDLPDKWSAEFYYDGVKVKKLRLGKGEIATIQLVVKPASEGFYKLKFAVNERIHSIIFIVSKGRRISVFTPIIVQEAKAGDKVVFPVSLTVDDSYLVSMNVTPPKDWNAYPIVDGVRVKEIYMRGEEAKVINIVLEIPRNADLGYHEAKVTLIFKDPNNGDVITERTLALGVNIYKTYKGQKATLKLRVVDDTGSPVAKALVRIGNETYATDSTGSLEVEVNPGEYELVVEKEGYEIKKEKIKLEDGEVKEVKLLLVREPYYFIVEPQSDVYPIVLGSVSRGFLITIENLGKNDDEYKLEISGIPENWNAMFTESPEERLEVTRVKVKAGTSKNVYLIVYPSLNAMPGTYNVTIKVTSSSGIEKTVPIKIKLIGSYAMNVRLLNYRITITAGEEKTTMLDIMNFGNAPITNIKVEVEGPQGWDIKVDPSQIPSLSPKDRESVRLSIKVPEGTTAGDYRIKITVKSDQTEWSDVLRVVVRQKSTSTYLGIVILILAFGFVVFMVRRVGRR